MPKLFIFNGRIGRKTYIINFLKIIGILLLSLILVMIIMFNTGFDFSILAIILLAYLTFTNVSKRLHDINFPSWIALIVIGFMTFSVRIGNKGIIIKPFELISQYIGIPNSISGIIGKIGSVIVALIIIYLLFKKGDEGENKYGKIPLIIENSIPIG